MIRVKNQKVMGNLSRRSLSANRTRNIIAVIAIALTTLLFAALFTIGGTITNSFEQQTFRQVGGDMHGTFKNVTEEQMKILAADPEVKRPAARLLLGMPSEAPFHKTHVEVSYMDDACVKGSFCTPVEGTLPEEGSNQIACDTRILKLLGVEPKIGASITLSYTLGINSPNGPQRTDTFTLSGWWDYDEASSASNALVPLSYAEQVLEGYVREGKYDQTGLWDLNVNLKNAAHIERDLSDILVRNGYQSDDPQGENFIATGVNWAYMGAQFAGNADAGTIAAVSGLLLIITFTGYLIINNIFQISVANDIRFYGLLKTIGTTGRQIRRLIRRQAITLSCVGIPIGLVLGYMSGSVLAPVIMSNMTYQTTHASANPLIFIGSAFFSLITVLLSCHRPGKLAAKVSPVEAVRYTEHTGMKKNVKKSRGGGKAFRMALSNLGRSKKKTILVVLSLSLAVVLLQVTYTFAGGFDMDKYLRHFVVSDYIVGNAKYFQSGAIFDSETAVPEEVIADVQNQGGITQGGRIYASSLNSKEWITEERYRENNGAWLGEESIDQIMAREPHSPEGLVTGRVDLYGMGKFPLDQLTVIDGDLAPLYDQTKHAIAAVYQMDDYNHPQETSQWAKVGDTVTLRHVSEWEYYNTESGETVDELSSIDSSILGRREVQYQDVTYTVAACVTMRNSMSFRYYGSDAFVLNEEVFQRDTGRSDVMTYLFDTEPMANNGMEAFLADYTENIEPMMDYESKQSYTDEFEGFRSMFILLGGTLSGVIGLVGVLNFMNAVLTSIMTRKREFAMLQSIGMTGGQLKCMLIFEGMFYALFAVGLSLILSLAAGPMLDAAMSSMFWFFTYQFTILPVLFVAPIFLLLGGVLPLIIYQFIARATIVERLRDAE